MSRAAMPMPALPTPTRTTLPLIAAGLLLLGLGFYYRVLYDLLLVALLAASSYGLGSLMNVRRAGAVETLLLRFLAGLGLTGFLAWAAALLGVQGAPFFALAGLAALVLRRRAIRRGARQAARLLLAGARANPVAAALTAAALPMVFAAACYPVFGHDALTKHLAIPVRMLAQDHYAYNVIESVIFGESALLAHSLFHVLLALGGTKALALLQAMLWLTLLLTLLHMTRKWVPGPWGSALLAAIFATTPFFFRQAYILYVDLAPFVFLFPALAALLRRGLRFAAPNAPLLGLVCGLAVFAKQTGLIFALPILAACAAGLVVSAWRREISTAKAARDLALCLAAFLGPLAPSLLIVWRKTGSPVFPMLNALYQSPYFPLANLGDFFADKPLGFDWQSLVNAVFHTDRNIEMPPGGMGVHLLLLPLLPLALLARRGRPAALAAILCVLALAAGFRSTFNLRYLDGQLLLAAVLCAYTGAALLSRIPFAWPRRLCAATLLLGLTLPNIHYVFVQAPPHSYAAFTADRLRPHREFTTAENRDILAPVNRPQVRLLAFNDNFRGDFRGWFSSISWYNSAPVIALRQGQLDPGDFLQGFDYYLYDKRFPDNMYFPGGHQRFLPNLELVAETQTHQLFKVRKADGSASDRTRPYLDRMLGEYDRKWPRSSR